MGEDQLKPQNLKAMIKKPGKQSQEEMKVQPVFNKKPEQDAISFEHICDYLERQLYAAANPATVMTSYPELALQDGYNDQMAFFFTEEYYQLIEIVNSAIELRQLQPDATLKLRDYIKD